MQVETLEALHNFDSIAGAADAIILSRGNLGLDVAPEKTAVVQKAAINRCNLLVGACPAVSCKRVCEVCSRENYRSWLRLTVTNSSTGAQLICSCCREGRLSSLAWWTLWLRRPDVPGGPHITLSYFSLPSATLLALPCL